MSKLDGFKKYEDEHTDGNDPELVASIMEDLPDMFARINAGAQFFLCVIDATPEDKLTTETGIHTYGALASVGAWEAVHQSFHEAAVGSPPSADITLD